MPAGRPSPYKKEFAKQAEKLCILGATENDLANFFEVVGSTIRKWAIEHPEFSAALKDGRGVADNRVERSLYHRAVGYSHEAVKIFLPRGSGEPIYAPYVEHVPPDTTACIFWLKNRRKDLWRDVHKHEHGAAGEFDKMTDDELRKDIAAVARRIAEGSPDEGGTGAPSEPGRLH